MNYVVQPGDTLYSIASRYGVTVQSLMQANGITMPGQVYAGQTIFIPRPTPPGPFPPGPGPFPPGPGPFPPGPGPAPGRQLEQRVARLETETDRLQQRLRRTDNEVDRLRQRVDRLEDRVRRLEGQS
jgi:LysM repeat protein